MSDYDLPRMASASGLVSTAVLPAIVNTQAQEKSLTAIVATIVAGWRRSVRESLISAVRSSQSAASPMAIEAALQVALRDSEVVVGQTVPRIDRWLNDLELWHRERFAANVVGTVRLDILPLMSRADVAPMLKAALERNVALIEGLSAELAKRVQSAIWTAYGEGMSSMALARVLREQFRFAPARARLIARDQLGSFSSSLDHVRHQQAGLTHYDWKTNLDGRERDTHRANNSKRFSWARPPKRTGHPGHEIRCRCKARAVIGSPI
jgi:SPP1 gp7 family putative phage head morphogenesis protein